MFRPTNVSAALVLAIFAVTPAVAQSTASPSDQEACTPDVFRLCQDYIPDETTIVACLRKKADQLSAACHQVFFPGAPPAAPRKTHAHHAKRRHAAH